MKNGQIKNSGDLHQLCLNWSRVEGIEDIITHMTDNRTNTLYIGRKEGGVFLEGRSEFGYGERDLIT